MEVWAHRGVSAKAPENTLPAFLAAIELSERLPLAGIEMDVHLTSDGVPVVCHDETVVRTAGVRGTIAQMTYGELCTLDFSRVKDRDFTEFAPCRIMTLQQVLEVVKPSKLKLNIELKTDKNPYPGIEDVVAAAVREAGMQERVVVSSFNQESVARFRGLAKDIPVAFLFKYPPFHLKRGIESGRWSAIHPRFSCVGQAMVNDAHAHGMAVRSYTVDDPKQALRLAKLGVDAIFANDPEAMIAVLAGE